MSNKCRFCGRKRRIGLGLPTVCDRHFMVECPQCGHEAFFMEPILRRSPSYVCFSLDCDWRSSRPPKASK
jgi:transposase-like protein